MSLLPFSLENRVTALTAKQDRLHVTFGDWILFGTTEEIDEIRNRMGSILNDARENSAAIPNPDQQNHIGNEWGTIFARPHQQGTFRAALSVRTKPLPLGGENIERPLFSGRWSFSPYVVSNPERQTRSRTQLDLWLNPTRYLRHQSPVPMPNPRERGGWPTPQMRGERLSPTIGEETSLDGNDNFLPTNGRWSMFSSPDFWWRHLDTYLDSIPATFEGELSRICPREDGLSPIGGCRYRVEPRLNLQLAEHYWEFSSENAIALVASLKPLILALSREYREERTYRQELSEGQERNATMLIAQVGAGREIRFYSKTLHRLRVEVIHTLGGEKGFRLRGGHTANEWDRLVAMLGTLAQDAAELVNEAFIFFGTLNNIPASHHTAIDLLLAICEHTRDFETATTIATLLVQNNTVAAGQTNEAMSRSLHALSTAGILEHTGQSRQTYVVTAPYRDALQKLRHEGNLSLLIARTRRRANA